jgi:hypothetical protein
MQVPSPQSGAWQYMPGPQEATPYFQWQPTPPPVPPVPPVPLEEALLLLELDAIAPPVPELLLEAPLDDDALDEVVPPVPWVSVPPAHAASTPIAARKIGAPAAVKRRITGG